MQVKYNRIIAAQQPGSTLALSTPYVEFDGNNKITVVGSPTISDVQAIMIGIRNPKKKANSNDDDGQAKCAEVWVDELRSDRFQQGGRLGSHRTGISHPGRPRADPADRSYRSANYADLEEKQTEHPLEEMTMLGFDTDLEFGKFFPEKTGIRIPVHFDYSLQKNTPKYDPMNPDLLLNNVVKAMETETAKDSVKALAEDLTERMNVNLMNVRKDRTKDRKPRVYDVENFSVSYAYSQIYHRDADITFDMRKKHMGGLGYNFANNPKNVQPFSRAKGLSKSKALQLIKDFNFYYLPRSFSFRTDMNREYDARQFRNKSKAIVPMETFYIKKWDWSRNYDLKYDFAKSVKISLNALAGSFINEPAGKVDKSNRDQIWNQIFSGGTMNTYTQQFSITWDLPFAKVPVLNFINLTAGYQAGYRWTASPVSVQAKLGNMIENNQTRALNGGMNFVTLYNKVPYLKKINSGQPTGKEQEKKLAEPKAGQGTKAEEPCRLAEGGEAEVQCREGDPRKHPAHPDDGEESHLPVHPGQRYHDARLQART